MTFFSWEESRPWHGLGRRLLCQAGGAAGLRCRAGWRSAKPPNPHSPRVLAICAICAVLVSQGKPLNIHSPRVLCCVALTRQATTLPRLLAICAKCAIWYRSLYTIHIASPTCTKHALYSTYSTYSKELGESGGSAAWRVRPIAHIAHIARSPETVGVQRLGVHAAPCRSKSGCPRCPQWEVESPTADNPSSLRRTLNQIARKFQCRESLHSRYLSL